MPIDSLTKRRLAKLPKASKYSSNDIIENFAILIDTHRDDGSVPSFGLKTPITVPLPIPRGMCHPVLVDYDIGSDMLIDASDSEEMARHDNHMFVANEFFAQFLVDFMMENGKDPRDGDGCLPTKFFRDPRRKIWELKSFREIVRLKS